MRAAVSTTILRARRTVAVLGLLVLVQIAPAVDEPPILPIPPTTAGALPIRQATPGSEVQFPEASRPPALPRLVPPRESHGTPPEASTPPKGNGLISRMAEDAKRQSPKPQPSALPAKESPAAPAVEFLVDDADHSLLCTDRRHRPTTTLSALQLGLHPAQVAAFVGGVPQVRTRNDFSSPLHCIDAGLLETMRFVDWTEQPLSPTFGVLVSEFRTPLRFAQPEGHSSAAFGDESNGSQLSWRDVATAGGRTWGFLTSVGQRIGSDYTPGADLFRIPASYNQWDGFAALSLDVAPNRTLDVFYLHHEQSNVELPGVAFDVRRSHGDQSSLRYAVTDGPERNERIVLLAWATELGYHGDSTATSKQATFFNRLIGVPFGPFAQPDRGRLANLFVEGNGAGCGARGYIRFGDGENAEILLGVDGRLERIAHREFNVNDVGTIAFGGNVFGVPDSSASFVGAFLTTRIKTDPATTAIFGGRFDAWRAEFNQADPVVAAGGPAALNTPTFLGRSEPERFFGSGFASLEFEFADDLFVHSGASYAMRPPSLAELYSDRSWTTLVRFGNSMAFGDAELDSERMLLFDLGARGQSAMISLQSRAFAARIGEYILYRPVPFGSGGSVQGNGPSNLQRFGGAAADNAAIAYQFANIPEATLVGGDASLEVRPQSWWTVFCALAYVRGINENPAAVPNGIVVSGDSEGLPGIAPLTSIVGFRVFEPECERYGLELCGRLVASQRNVADSLGEIGTPGYTAWNLRGWVRIGEGIRISSAVRNFFNRDYTQHGSLAIANPRDGNVFFTPEPGISFATSVEVSW